MKRAQYIFGTICSIEVAGCSDSVASCGIEAGFSELRRISMLANPHDSKSELSKLNNSHKPTSICVDEELIGLIEKALNLSCMSDGKYDPTVWPLIELWKKCEALERMPYKSELKMAVSLVDAKSVHVNRESRSVSLNKHVRLDLSSVIKGYASDCALDVIKNYELERAIINLGGSILVWEVGGYTEPIGIFNPVNRKETLGVINLSNSAISTSNQGEVHFLVDGKAMGHIFDPKTGVPVSTDILSVSVVTESALEADMLSTASFLLGVDGGCRLIEQHKGASALFVTKNEEYRCVGKMNFSEEVKV